MKIIYDKTKNFKFSLISEFSHELLAFCQEIKKTFGWQNFSFISSKWRFTDLNIINAILEKFPDTEINEETNKKIIEQQIYEIKKEEKEKEISELKNKKDSDIKIEGIKGELFPYQKVGVEFFIMSNGKAILADTMGLGKTLQALAYICHAKKNKTLIICPASVKYGWNLEIKKWTNLRSIIINSKDVITPDVINDNDVFIINYDIMKIFFDVEVNEIYNPSKGKKEKKKKFTIKPLFNLVKFDCVVCDEVHMIKNSSAMRSQLVKRLVSQVESAILMSGTVILNRPVEIFNALNLIDPNTWNSWFAFTKRYCNGHQGRFGWDFSGSSNLDELQQRISKYFLRRTKEDVNADLPPKRKIDVPVELDAQKYDEYCLAEDSFKEYLKEIKNASDKKIASAMRAEQLGKLNALRQITSLGKVEHAKELIQSIVDSGEKAVIFSVYNEPLEILKKHFKDISVSITGKTPIEDRGDYIKSFQENDKIRLFLGGLKACGTGITLTSGKNVVFLDYAWTPGDMEQGIDRIHRWGQVADKITIYQLYSPNTIDERMKEILKKKEVIFNKLMKKNDSSLTSSQNNSVMNDLLNFYEKK